jgi:hypothetical protein
VAPLDGATVPTLLEDGTSPRLFVALFSHHNSLFGLA